MLNFSNLVDMYYYDDGDEYPDALYIVVTWQKRDWIFHGYMQTVLSPLEELKPSIQAAGWTESTLVCSCETIANHVEIRKLNGVSRLFIYDWLRYQTFQAVVESVTGKLVKFRLI